MVEAQIGFAGAGIRTVALVTVLGDDRLDVGAEREFRRGAGGGDGLKLGAGFRFGGGWVRCGAGAAAGLKNQQGRADRK